MPAPGSPAEKALEARRIRSGKEHKKFTMPGLAAEPEPEQVQDVPAVAQTKPGSGQRQQPKRKKRVKPAGQSEATTRPNLKPGPIPEPLAEPLAPADSDA